MKGIMKLRSTVALQRLVRCQNFHDASNANIIKSKVDRSSKEFQVNILNFVNDN